MHIAIGCRPSGKDLHKSVFEFLEASGFDRELVDYFNGIRKKRRRAVYELAGAVSESEAKEAIEQAEEFVFIFEFQ